MKNDHVDLDLDSDSTDKFLNSLSFDQKQQLCAIFVLTACYILHQERGGKASDLHLRLDVSIEDMYEGGHKIITFFVFDEMGNKRSKKIRISLVNFRETYVFAGMGDASPFVNMFSGDVIVELHVLSHPVFRIGDGLLSSEYDLLTTMYVTLFDFYYGVTKHLSLPVRKREGYGAEDIVDVTYDENAARRTQCVIPGKGLPMPYPSSRGDMVVEFQLVLPDLSSRKLHNPITRAFIANTFGESTKAEALRKSPFTNISLKPPPGYK